MPILKRRHYETLKASRFAYASAGLLIFDNEAAEKTMGLQERFTETLANYERHGWQLRRVLLRPESLAELGEGVTRLFENAPVAESTLDALWFARSSHAGREAWELRLVAPTPYALFETFEADEAEEEREEVRQEMEARLREYVRERGAVSRGQS